MANLDRPHFIGRCIDQRVSDRAALGEKQFLQPVLAFRGRGKSINPAARARFQYHLERRGGHVMAFVDDHHPVAGQRCRKIFHANQGRQHGNVESAREPRRRPAPEADLLSLQSEKSHGGLLDPLKEEERLASLISDRIAPRLIPTIDVIAWRSAQLIVAEVFPSSNRPHYLKNLGPEEGVFVRIGSTNRKADAALMQELRRMASNETFDESPLAELDSEALDFRAASESFPARGQLKKADFQTLRLLTPPRPALGADGDPCRRRADAHVSELCA